MTLAAVWRVDERVYAIADTRITREAGNILTDRGPKLLPITLVCKQVDISEPPVYQTTIGYAYAGATLPALATHALANTLCQNLLGPAGANLPGLDLVTIEVRDIADRYIREIGELSGLGSLFSAIVFGFCPQANRFRAFRIIPELDGGVLSTKISEHDLYGSDTLLVIGNRPELLRERVCIERPKLYADPQGISPQMQTLREIDLPKRALQSLIDEGADENIGGAIQAAWLTRAGFQPVFHRDQKLGFAVLGFNISEFNVGPYAFAPPGRM